MSVLIKGVPLLTMSSLLPIPVSHSSVWNRGSCTSLSGGLWSGIWTLQFPGHRYGIMHILSNEERNYLFVCVCLFVCLFVCLSVCLFACLFVCVSVCRWPSVNPAPSSRATPLPAGRLPCLHCYHTSLATHQHLHHISTIPQLISRLYK